MRPNNLRLGFIADNRIAFDGVDYRYRTGEWRYIEHIAPLFDSVDLCVKVDSLEEVATEIRNEYPYTLDAPNIVVHHLNDGAVQNGWVNRQLFTYRMLRKLSKQWDFAFLVMPGWPAFIGWLQSRWNNWDYALWARADWPGAAIHRIKYRPSAQRWLRLLLPFYSIMLGQIERLLLRNASIRMADGGFLASKYPEYTNSMIRMVDTTLSLEEFRKKSDPHLQKPTKICYVGSLIKRKGLDISLKAIAQLVEEGFDLEFHIAGTGPELESLRNLSQILGLEERVIFHGYIPNGPRLLDFFYGCDIFLLTSYSEGFPRVIYESLSQSTPVVVTDVGGIGRALEHERHTLLLTPGSIEETTNSLRRVLTDDSLRLHLRTSGYEFALASIENHPIQEVYEELRAQVQQLPCD